MPNFVCKANGDSLDMLMYGYFGEDFRGDGSSIDARSVAKALNANKSAKQINMRINSPGGSAWHGLAIYESLKSHGAKIHGKVDGLAASAGSLVLMAADEIEMNEAGLVMIHRSSVGAIGTGEDLRKTAEVADKLDQSMAEIYAARTGLPQAEVVAMLYQETWLTAAEAKTKNFAQTISKNKAMAAQFRDDQFQDVPERVKPLLALLHFEEGTPTMTTPAPAATVQEPLAPAVAMTTAALTPVAPAAPVLSAAAAPLIDVEKIKADAKAEAQAAAKAAVDAERQRAAEINAACLLAKKPEMAAKLIESGETVAAAKDKLFTAVCETLPVANVDQPPDKPADKGDAKFIAEYKADAAYAKAMTQDEYVAMRRIDTGVDEMKVGVPVK